MIGKRVQAGIWGYVPSFDGEDVDKDYDGDVIGVVESVTPYNPHVFRVKVEMYRPNIKDAPWTTDLSGIGGGLFLGLISYENGYIEEWDHNLVLVGE